MSERYDLAICGGEVVTPEGILRTDVGIRKGRFAHVGPLEGPADDTVDARGLHVLPGAVDAHVHLGVVNTGARSKDDHGTGTLAAICGGVTTVGDFSVQDPEEDLKTSVERRITGAGHTACDWFLHANLTSPSPEALDQIPGLVETGIASFKLFLAYPEIRVDADTLEAVLHRVDDAGGLVMVHAEDQGLIDRAVAELVARGRTTPRHFFDSRPPRAEATAIRTLGNLALATGHPIYVVHLSSAAGLDAALDARRAGANMYLETCPQYLFLTRGHGDSRGLESLVCAPPLRDDLNRESLAVALARGDLDVLATDHCPYTLAQKQAHGGDFRRIPGGLPGVETLLPLGYHLALNGTLDPGRLAGLTAHNPARLFGLAHRKGAIRVGLDGDFVLLDPNGSTRITAANLHSDTDYSPYEGLDLKGALRSVYLKGRLTASRNPEGVMEPVGEPRGEFLPCDRR
ncbi:MAG: amidohydrolase family protein [Deltaproteobacteria bacterium]|nr:amidohydrolase family protein [Deltaproteobacteria bacterium]